MRAADSGDDVPIPGKIYGLLTLQRAQAIGDYRALVERERRVLRVIFIGRSRRPSCISRRPSVGVDA